MLVFIEALRQLLSVFGFAGLGFVFVGLMMAPVVLFGRRSRWCWYGRQCLWLLHALGGLLLAFGLWSGGEVNGLYALAALGYAMAALGLWVFALTTFNPWPAHDAQVIDLLSTRNAPMLSNTSTRIRP